LDSDLIDLHLSQNGFFQALHLNIEIPETDLYTLPERVETFEPQTKV